MKKKMKIWNFMTNFMMIENIFNIQFDINEYKKGLIVKESNILNHFESYFVHKNNIIL